MRIGGFDIRDVTQESLHDSVGVVTQDAYLFHDTIRANLAYARPGATEAELIEACRAAQIWDLISVLPDGLDTIVGDRGYRLSGGEKQRVALARLLLKAPAVVVLDEATAHLDSESEVAVQQALAAALAGPHLAGHRAPAVHHPRGRPDPGHRRRPGLRARPARRAARVRRTVRRLVPDPVRPPGARRRWPEARCRRRGITRRLHPPPGADGLALPGPPWPGPARSWPAGRPVTGAQRRLASRWRVQPARACRAGPAGRPARSSQPSPRSLRISRPAPGVPRRKNAAASLTEIPGGTERGCPRGPASARTWPPG